MSKIINLIDRKSGPMYRDPPWEERKRDLNIEYDLIHKCIDGIAKDYGVSEDCAITIYLVRGRMYWSKRLEQFVIKAFRTGNKLPDINDHESWMTLNMIVGTLFTEVRTRNVA